MAEKLLGWAVGKAAEGIIKMANAGKINSWFKPLAAKYREGDEEKYVVYTIVEEKKIEKGPTLLIAGEVDENSARKIEENIIRGIAHNYAEMYQNSGKVRKKKEQGRFRTLENRIDPADDGYSEFYNQGGILVQLVTSSKTIRGKLEKFFRRSGFKYEKDTWDYLPEPPAINKFKGKDYLWKFEEEKGFLSRKMATYVLPVNGLPRMWYKVHYLDLSGKEDFMNLIRKTYELQNKGNRNKEEEKELKTNRELVKSYLKDVINGKI